MRLFYFKEKLTAPLRYGGKTIKKYVSVKKPFLWRYFLLQRKLLKHLWKRKKMGKTYTRCWTLGWTIPEVSLLLWRKNKGYKERERERPEGKCLENSSAVFNSIFMNNKGPSHTLKGHTFFFISFTKKFIIQITWNSILYHWHASPAINYGKLLILFFF